MSNVADMLIFLIFLELFRCEKTRGRSKSNSIGHLNILEARTTIVPRKSCHALRALPSVLLALALDLP